MVSHHKWWRGDPFNQRLFVGDPQGMKFGHDWVITWKIFLSLSGNLKSMVLSWTTPNILVKKIQGCFRVCKNTHRFFWVFAQHHLYIDTDTWKWRFHPPALFLWCWCGVVLPSVPCLVVHQKSWWLVSQTRVAWYLVVKVGGGGFISFKRFSPRTLGRISNMTNIYFSDGLVQPPTLT